MRQQKGKNVWVGYVGRIATEKGLEYLVQSIKRLDNVKLAITGPIDTVGENNYRKQIETLLKENNVDYLFLGQVTSKLLSAFYKTIDVLVLPSVNQTEAFGMVQVEAMLSGTPVIASNLPGVRIPIKLTKMGLLVEPEKSNQIAKAVTEIIKNRKKYTNPILIENAKKIFDNKKTYKFYDDLIEKN